MDFFFDNQCRRYLLQFMRIFSDIKVRNGPDANGNYTLTQVPIMYGDPSSIVAQAIKGGSENTTMPSPMMSAYIIDIKMNEKRRANPQMVDHASVLERSFDKSTNTYGSQPGARLDVDRYMPVPYDFSFKLDIWTTNTNFKLQIFEQIAIIFNPSIQLQQNSNYLDWTAIFECFLEDVTWTNRNMPQGDGDQKDIMSLRFRIPGWINPPAKLKRSSMIDKITTRVFDVPLVDVINLEEQLDGIYHPLATMCAPHFRIVSTLGNYKISVTNNNDGTDIITLLDEHGNPDPCLHWVSITQIYGGIIPGVTTLTLKLDSDACKNNNDVIGTIKLESDYSNKLLFKVNSSTLPANTIPPISDIIDPTELSPGHGLPASAIGQRYLITSKNTAGEEPAIPYNVPLSPWGTNIIAYPNDIIQFNGIDWVVIFNASGATENNYVINNANGSQYLFDITRQEWQYSYYGIFSPGYWSLNNLQANTSTTSLDGCA